MDLDEELKSFCDFGNVVLPEINLSVELLVVRRTLHVAQLDNMVFDDLIDVISGGNLEVLFIVSF